MLTRVPIESNFYNSCPKDIKLNQSWQDMSLPVVIQFGGNPGFNKTSYFQFNLFGTFVTNCKCPFCHEDSSGELCKMDILVVVS